MGEDAAGDTQGEGGLPNNNSRRSSACLLALWVTD